jgi:hypothetical protein
MMYCGAEPKRRTDAASHAPALKLWHCTPSTPMPPRPFVNDGLWRCLCPGFPSNAVATPYITRGGPRLPHGHASRKDATSHCSRQSRAYHSSNPLFTANDSFFSQPGTSAARLERSCALRASEVPETMLHSRSNQHISSTNMREMRAQRATGTR